MPKLLAFVFRTLDGDRLKQEGSETYLIEQCDSPLAIRIALRRGNDDPTIRVLLTSLDEANLVMMFCCD
jgi:hypothetical protein